MTNFQCCCFTMCNKVNHAAMLAPAISLQYTHEENLSFRINEILHHQVSSSIGSLNAMQIGLLSVMAGIPGCIKDRIQGYPCSNTMEQLFGLGMLQWDQIKTVETMIAAMSEGSLHEYGHLAQTDSKNKLQCFDFRDAQRNVLAYGSLDVPGYDLKQIDLGSLSIWQGNTDRLVNQLDVYTLLREINCKCK